MQFQHMLTLAGIKLPLARVAPASFYKRTEHAEQSSCLILRQGLGAGIFAAYMVTAFTERVIRYNWWPRGSACEQC